MPTPDLSDEDYSDLAALVRDAIDAEPYRIGPQINRLRVLLAKLEPKADGSGISPYPALRPSGEPSLLFRKLRGGRRWR